METSPASLSSPDSGAALFQTRTRLLVEVAHLVAQRNAVDRSAPGAAAVLLRIGGSIHAKARELREVNVRLASATPVLDALCKRAALDKALMDMGFEPEPGYVERTYGAGWHRKPEPAPQPVLDAIPHEPVPPALDPIMALAAVTDRMADLIETQAAVMTAALNAPAAQPPVIHNDIVVQPATVDVSVTATIPPRQTVSEVERDKRTGDIARVIQTEREAPADH